MMRSIGAVVAGLLFIVVGSTVVDLLLYALGVYPANQPLDDKLAALATAYRAVIGVAGAWITARLAPSRPMQHAMILGLIGVVLGLAGVVVAIEKPELGPLWYPIGLVLLAIPQCWAGGKLYEAQTGR
jgi:hypothetical protein